MIKKVLIANRGEIASRIIRTCKENGIQTVAIYSEADADSPYVKQADESYLIGPPRVNESYLRADKIIEIAKMANVDAIHPGYGFLSENGGFARQCEENGIIFIGPSAEVMEQMGDKIAARNMMKRAGVPIIPGTDEAIDNVDEAIKLANEIGYPIMLKAAAGGGGIGMQVVRSDDELQRTFESNSKRAEQFFGNGAMFIEKLVENARHIEVQVIADKHGNAIHLFERECSVQRRNQKVLEEAPSPFISEETRKKMGEASVKAAKEIGYFSAGTIEYLVDEHEQFYFLEMNTRIQVEHAITEQITGLDIVKLQLDVAEGKKLPLSQEDVARNGHSIEARIYAEDPVTFFPSPGTIETYKEPSGEHVRIESSVKQGSQVTPFYDPMIGKLIVTGKDRAEAIQLLDKALDEYEITGIKTNIPMLKTVVNEENFKRGNTTTDYVQKHYLPLKTK